jgi:hypothetical protein
VDFEVGYKLFYQFNPIEYSTMDRDRYLEMIKNGMAERKKYKVRCYVLDDLLEVVSPQDPFFMSIDTEGHDLQILLQLTKSNSRPRVICVEEFNTSSVSIRELLEHIGYNRVFKSNSNGVYVHREYLESTRDRRPDGYR